MVPAPDAVDVGTQPLWLPLLGEWRPHRVPPLHVLREGLAQAGIASRIDVWSDDPLSVHLLRVCCPGPSYEGAEQWLLQRVRPWHEAGAQWASDVESVTWLGWRSYELVSADAKSVRRLHSIASLPRSANRWITHCGIGSILHPKRRATFFTFARTAIEAVLRIPGVRCFGAPVAGDLSEWPALDVQHGARGVRQLAAFGAGLQARGFDTRRHEWNDGATALLTVHAGHASLEELEERLAVALGTPPPAWASSYHPWSWEAPIRIHRASPSHGWLLREWLEGELGVPVVNASQSQQEPIELIVPRAYVDRALAALARRPDLR